MLECIFAVMRMRTTQFKQSFQLPVKKYTTVVKTNIVEVKV